MNQTDLSFLGKEKINKLMIKFSIPCVLSLLVSALPIISYNIGANNIKRVKELYKKILLCTLIIGLGFTLLFELAPNFVVGIFGNPNNIPNPNDYWEYQWK